MDENEIKTDEELEDEFKLNEQLNQIDYTYNNLISESESNYNEDIKYIDIHLKRIRRGHPR